jgi:hypothetical protein
VKIFEPGRVHYQGDIVIHDGSLYQAVRDTGRDIPHADWICLARAGRDALSPNVRGTYDTHETYQRLDIVALDGASFIARRVDPGLCPGDGWQVIAAHGARGEKGSHGPRGEKGDPGERGEPAPTTVAWLIDRERYRASPRMSDGTVGPMLELRELFEQFLSETS